MPPPLLPLVIFHKNCLDGRGAAAVIGKFVGECEFLPLQYGMKRPTVTDRRVFVVDFGLKIEDMRGLYAEAKELTWLDHHASQVPMREALAWGIVDTSECGTSLAWKHCFPGKPPPPVVDYIKDKDLWLWKLPDSRAIVAGLEATFSDQDFTGLLQADLAAMAEKGRPIVEELFKRVQATAANGLALADAYGIPGMRALAVRTRKDLNELGEHICLPTEAGGLGYDLAVLYYCKGPDQWVHSLRSADPLKADCAVIAAARGGGGHPSAASYLGKEPIVPKSVKQKEV